MATAIISFTDYKNELIKTKENVANGLFRLGKLLYEISNEKLYEEEYETFEEFIGDPEISFSRITAYKAMKIYEVYGLKLNMLDKVMDIDADKLYRISKLIEAGKVDADEWIEKARTLSRSDLTNETREQKGLPKHDYAISTVELVKTFLYEYCKKKDLKPDTMELEELLCVYDNWRKRR